MFEEGASATENSPIGYGNDLVLENNAGYPGPFGDPLLTVAGLSRVHVKEDYSGCELVWHTEEFRAQTTPRLSTANGLVYTYSVVAGQPVHGIPTYGWYFGALEWHTGERVYEVWVGSGHEWNNILDPVPWVRTARPWRSATDPASPTSRSPSHQAEAALVVYSW
jgi:hypothetical protein